MAELETVIEAPEFKNKDGAGDAGDDMEEMEFAKRRGCCFWIPCFDSDRTKSSVGGSVWWERIRTSENKDRWWIKGWKKVREWSEIAAGPKWKTFIRRFNRNNKGGGSAGGGRGKFQYDPLSYSLNFDHGPGQHGDPEDDLLFRDFSSRYAAIPMSAKSSMDLGKDAPSFI